jgi:hypothetical protein
MTDGRNPGREGAGEGGFALILAILSLMLLTFLGLTLATTTSTELQIATNYRWSQMALYNAEAGLEAARIVLSDAADEDDGWKDLLPERRTAPTCPDPAMDFCWDDGAAPGPVETVCSNCRDFEKMGCDTRGGIGYGLVLDDGVRRLENTSAFLAQPLNGAFTVWIRRGLDVGLGGQFSDSDDDFNLVIVSEGVAPYTGASTAFTRARQAVRVLETRYALVAANPTDPCQGGAGQEGGTQSGDNFNSCALVTSGSLEGAFGQAGTGATGSLTGTGAR